jgi:hypothetical protein
MKTPMTAMPIIDIKSNLMPRIFHHSCETAKHFQDHDHDESHFGQVWTTQDKTSAKCFGEQRMKVGRKRN